MENIPTSDCDNASAEIAEEDLYCLVCEKIVIEQDGDLGNAGDNAVFCEGACQGWFHRICVGLIKFYIAVR